MCVPRHSRAGAVLKPTELREQCQDMYIDVYELIIL